MRIHHATEPAPILTLCALIVACGMETRNQDVTGDGIDSVGSASNPADGGGSTTGNAGGDDDDSGGGDGGSSSGAGSAVDESSSDDDGPKFDIGDNAEGSTGAEDSCNAGQDEDLDGDGWSIAEGDCNDCDANANPGAIEVVLTEPDDMGVVPEPADEDCDGDIDNLAPPCDGALTFDDDDPFSAAAAMGLCKVAADEDDWGLISATWVRADGGAANVGMQFGIQDGFGPNVDVREGARLLALSSGRGRIPGQAGACNSLTCGGTGVGDAPNGFPQDVPQCPGLSNILDDIALEVTLRTPSNATGFSYNFDFYSFEYPEWVCTEYNDQYIALVEPPPQGSIDGNISFDSLGNPVSVNIAYFDVCDGCSLGTSELQGTGFDTWDDAGATSWLVTTAPVEGKTEVTIRFTIWDTGDAQWDSTVLLDNFQWIADGAQVDVGTEPEG